MATDPVEDLDPALAGKSNPPAVKSADKPAGKGRASAQRRSAARLAAVQALYQMDIAGTGINDVIADFVANRLGSGAAEEELVAADPQFFADLVRGVVKRQREIDPIIDEQLAERWRLNRIDATLRAALRAGAFELTGRPDVPARVIIDEYVEVTHAFFSGDEPRVANGVLDQIARRARPLEFGIPAA